MNLKQTTQSKFKENSIATLKVSRKSKFGAFLDAETGNTNDDILLHEGQQTRDVEVGEELTVYLYNDPHHRLTASMRLPQIPLDGIGYVTVLNTTRFGAFVDVGTERGIFLPFSEMIERVTVDQQIWVKLYIDKTGRLATTMHVDEEMKKIAKPCENVKVGDFLVGTIYNITKDGAFLITRDRELGFIHRNDFTKDIVIGKELKVRVSFIRKDGHFNAQLRAQKEDAMADDMEVIVKLMNEHQGILPLTESSAPDLIKDKLGMSKSAFKRAIGHLLKENKINIVEGKISMK